MSIKITENALYLRDEETGELLPVGLFGSGATESLEHIREVAEQAVSEMEEKRDQVVASIPEDYAALVDSVAQLMGRIVALEDLISN